MKRRLWSTLMNLALIGGPALFPLGLGAGEDGAEDKPLTPAQQKAKAAQEAKDAKELAKKELDAFCQEEIQKRLKALLENEDNKKILKDIINEQANLSVARATYAFLRLQKQYNKRYEKTRTKGKEESDDVEGRDKAMAQLDELKRFEQE